MALVVVLGSANIDMVVPVAQLPGPGETVLGGPLGQYFGGKGANQAVAARRAGAEVALVARFGQDDFGFRYRAYLSQEGVDLASSTTDPNASTGVAIISVDKSGQNQIAVAGGANSTLEVTHVYRAGTLLRRADVLLCQLETPLISVGAALRAARDGGAKTILNPAPVLEKRLPRKVLKYVDLLTPNEVEAARLSGLPTRTIKDVRKAAEAILKMGCLAVCVTLGPLGALLVERERVERIQPFKVRAVDTTGCGDAFNGALAAAWAAGLPLQEAVVWGTAAGALAARTKGAQPSLPAETGIRRLASQRIPKKKKSK